MTFVTRNLVQTITYWAVGVPDGFGGETFTAPVSLKGRWEDRSDLFIDVSGNESHSEAVVYVDTDVEIGGYLLNDSSTASDPTVISGAREIRSFRKIPSLNAKIFERKVWL